MTLLEGMLNDNTDFVRQGASIAMALVLLQQPESVVEPFRKKVSIYDSCDMEHVCKAWMGSLQDGAVSRKS